MPECLDDEMMMLTIFIALTFTAIFYRYLDNDKFIHIRVRVSLAPCI